MQHAALVKRAELASGVGALVLGTGLGVVFGRFLVSAGIPLLFAGGLLHGWGMYDKHRIERGSAAEDVRFAAALYWACWILLAAVLGYLIVR